MFLHVYLLKSKKEYRQNQDPGSKISVILYYLYYITIVYSPIGAIQIHSIEKNRNELQRPMHQALDQNQEDRTRIFKYRCTSKSKKINLQK